MKPKIFLSYAREDQATVEQLYNKLTGAGFDPWMDTEKIQAGAKWERRIEQAIKESHFFIACITAISVAKRGILRKEFDAALEKQKWMPEEDIYLLPIRLEDCSVPGSMNHLQWHDYFAPDSWDSLLQTLRDEADRRGLDVAAPDNQNPFHPTGRINDPAHFHGRERLVREICDELKKRSSVSLVGDSQIGKSSLLYYLFSTCGDWLPGTTVAYVDLQSVLDEEDFCETVLSLLGQKGDSLRDLKRALLNRDLVLLLDEVERLAEPDFNPRLHDLLRSLAQEPQFAMCLSTRRPLSDVFPASAPGGVSPFHNIFTPKTLGPFTSVEARAFLRACLKNTPITFTKSEIDRLLSDSACHPAALQRLAHVLFAEKTP